jgi:hypothetical protein
MLALVLVIELRRIEHEQEPFRHAQGPEALGGHEHDYEERSAYPALI